MELSTEPIMKKRKGSLAIASETISGPEAPEYRSKSGGGDVIGITLRLSREAWRDLHEMAVKENVSLNTLMLMMANEYRRTRSLPLLKPTPTIRKE
jgi:predicted DNA-binding ribbon-helix-helix protein